MNDEMIKGEKTTIQESTNDKDTIYKIIGARIKHLRTMLNWSQVKLGNKIGFGGTTISNYENGYSQISVDMLRKIADAFGVSITYFTDIDNKWDLKSIEQILTQKNIAIQMIPYYKSNNTKGILSADIKQSDGYISFPWQSMYNNTIICTDIPDHDMANLDYKKGEHIFVNTGARPMSGEAALIYDTINDKMILRKYMSDGPMVTLLADGYNEVPPIYSDITDPDYKVIGPVVRSTRDH